MGTITESYRTFCDQIPEVLNRFKNLHQVTTENGKIFLRGNLDVVDKDSQYWESYEVEIHHTEGFPFKFPDVYEIGGKIPRIADWHIYEDTLTCCLTVPPLEIIKCLHGITLDSFIESEVLPYFFNQTHRRVEGYYVNGEYSHGYLGILEFFDTELKTRGAVRDIVSLLFKIADSRKPGRADDCFCGRKIKYRKCHRSAYETLSKIGTEKLRIFANYIAKESGNGDLVR
jgi:hypothetical protein